MAKIQKELFTQRLKKGKSQEEIAVSGPNQAEGDKFSCHKASPDIESNEKCEGFPHQEGINQQEEEEKCAEDLKSTFGDLSNDFLDDAIIKTLSEVLFFRFHFQIISIFMFCFCNIMKD